MSNWTEGVRQFDIVFVGDKEHHVERITPTLLILEDGSRWERRSGAEYARPKDQRYPRYLTDPHREERNGCLAVIQDFKHQYWWQDNGTHIRSLRMIANFLKPFVDAPINHEHPYRTEVKS